MANHRKPGPLSVHQGHEVLLKLEEAGLNQDSAQKIIQSSGNQLAKKMLSLIPHDSISEVNPREAKMLVGAVNFFGPYEWYRHVDYRFSIDQTPPIPWTRVQLTERPSFLFLGMKMGKRAVNLTWLDQILGNQHDPKIASNWFLSDSIGREGLALVWYLMPLETMTQLTLDYTLASAVERIVANVLYYKINSKYLDESAWALTRSHTDDGNGVRIRARESVGGVEVYRPTDANSEAFVYAASRNRTF